MSKKREVQRKYAFADSWLIELCNTRRQFIIRDIAEFSAYSVDALVMTDFENETNAFEAFQTDEELAGIQSEKTEVKDASAEAVKTDVRGIMTRVESKHKPQTARYRRFGTKGMDEMDDNHLLACGRRVARVATDVLADYADVGLMAAIITELETKCQSLEDALNEQADAVANRDIATEDRIEMGNALYGKLTNYCSFGQQIWAETDEAKYNDYIIYTSEGKLAEPIEGTVEAEQTVNIMNKTFEPTDEFKLENTGTVQLRFCLAPDGVTACDTGIEVNSGENITVTASELGDPATNEFLNVTNLDASEQGSYKVTEL